MYITKSKGMYVRLDVCVFVCVCVSVGPVLEHPERLSAAAAYANMCPHDGGRGLLTAVPIAVERVIPSVPCMSGIVFHHARCGLSQHTTPIRAEAFAIPAIQCGAKMRRVIFTSGNDMCMFCGCGFLVFCLNIL